MKKRKVWLLFFAPLIIPFALFFREKEKPCADKVVVTVGDFSSLAQGQRAALQQLSAEVKRCPKAQTYKIRRNDGFWKRWDEAYLEITIYQRETGFLQDGAPVFGAHTQWKKVTEAAIHKVAATSGDFGDFGKYGAEYAMP